ncbi:MAG: UDP-3-O-acyl-N-acetylglucosamine deacetylase [Thermodesulfobacteriota bacterium]
MEFLQHTLEEPVSIAGIGLHSGRQVVMVLRPAPANSGIRFIRTDLPGRPAITASYANVSDTRLATTLSQNGASVATVEHLLAAVMQSGVDNLTVEIDGPEVPIMDGSAAPFLRLLDKRRKKAQSACRRAIRILRPVEYRQGDAWVTVSPHDGLKVTCEIDFADQVIRRQKLTVSCSSRSFSRDIAKARTFGFFEDIERLRKNGLALGGSLENAVVVNRFGVMNEGGLRFADEFVRHKILDLIGDLSLLGAPLLGRVVASKSGHGHHLGFMQTLMADSSAWEYVQHGHGHSARERCAVQPLDAVFPCLFPPPVAGKPAAL